MHHNAGQAAKHDNKHGRAAGQADPLLLSAHRCATHEIIFFSPRYTPPLRTAPTVSVDRCATPKKTYHDFLCFWKSGYFRRTFLISEKMFFDPCSPVKGEPPIFADRGGIYGRKNLVKQVFHGQYICSDSLSYPLVCDIISARSLGNDGKHKKCRKRGQHMTEQALAARRAYRRKWAKKNPDKVKAQQERYWTKKAAQAAAEQEREPAPAPAE